MVVGGPKMEVGFFVDGLDGYDDGVVTFVSLMVHRPPLASMADDPAQTASSRTSPLFIISMLMLVASNNFLQLFFGWEAVGLVSYLLIGTWFNGRTAIFANMKAFLVNRVGDFGFILGIGLIAAYAGTLNYGELFAKKAAGLGHAAWHRLDADHRDLHLSVHRRDGQVGAVPAACLAAGLDGRPDADLRADPRRHHGDAGPASSWCAHVAAVRAASDDALNFVLVIGAITALFMGFLGMHPERHQARGGLPGRCRSWAT